MEATQRQSTHINMAGEEKWGVGGGGGSSVSTSNDFAVFLCAGITCNVVSYERNV